MGQGPETDNEPSEPNKSKRPSVREDLNRDKPPTEDSGPKIPKHAKPEDVRKLQRNHSIPAIRIPFWAQLCIAVALSFGSLFVCLWLQPLELDETLSFITSASGLILLNWLPLLLCTLALTFLMGNAFFSAAIVDLVFFALNYANLLKIEGRDDPVVAADFGLLREAMNATEEYRLEMHVDMIAVWVLVVVALIAIGIFIRSKRYPMAVRIIGFVAFALALVASVQTVYKDNELFESYSGEGYHEAEVFNRLGFNYCFLHFFDTYSINMPEGYSAAAIEDWIEANPEPTYEASDRIDANVVMVMCEAFTDLSKEDAFEFDSEDDPLRDFHAVTESDRAISGHLVIPGFGGGTANTEFEVQTGMQTRLINNMSSNAFSVIRHDVRSIASDLASDGYYPYFLHPGHDWFYNRKNVYNYLGIPNQVFQDSFKLEDSKGPFVSEAAFLKRLEDDIDGFISRGDDPFFAYGVTIQNHQTYSYEKYYYWEPPIPPTNVELTDAGAEQLSVYFEGLRDSATMLLELTEYLDTLEEPTVLAFFGDHRPAMPQAIEDLGLGYSASDAEGKAAEDTIKTYETPYVIWVNEAFAEAEVADEAFERIDLPDDSVISANYLGAACLELIGHDGDDPFMVFLNEMRREIPVFRTFESIYLTRDDEGGYSFTSQLSDADSKWIQDFRYWEYYRLTD